MKKPHYTFSEIEQLRNLFNQNKSDEEIASIMGRGIEGIKAKRRRLGLLRPDAVEISIKNGHNWTKNDLQFICNYWRTKSDKWMAEKLGVSVSSYKHKRQRMILTSPTGHVKPARFIKHWTHKKGSHITWTFNQELFLRENYPTHSAKDLAAYLGRNENAIQWKAKRMGLKKNFNPGRKGYEPLEQYYDPTKFKPKLII